jgi:hypothetical protein
MNVLLFQVSVYVAVGTCYVKVSDDGLLNIFFSFFKVKVILNVLAEF